MKVTRFVGTAGPPTVEIGVPPAGTPGLFDFSPGASTVGVSATGFPNFFIKFAV